MRSRSRLLCTCSQGQRSCAIWVRWAGVAGWGAFTRLVLPSTLLVLPLSPPSDLSISSPPLPPSCHTRTLPGIWSFSRSPYSTFIAFSNFTCSEQFLFVYFSIYQDSLLTAGQVCNIFKHVNLLITHENKSKHYKYNNYLTHYMWTDFHSRHITRRGPRGNTSSGSSGGHATGDYTRGRGYGGHDLASCCPPGGRDDHSCCQ